MTFDGAVRAGAAHWKLGPLDEYGSGRALAWIDDNFDESCYEWAEQRDEPTLLGPDRDPPRPRGGPRRGLAAVGHVSRLSPVEGFWPIFFLLVVLKIPVFAALWLIWWASKAPEPEASRQRLR